MASSGAGDDVDMSAGAGSGGGGRTITEAALYDRQLRMWGHDAQRRMRDTRVLVTGFRGTTSEVTKNLVLGGIGVTLHDTGVATEADLGAHLFLRPADVGANVSDASLCVLLPLPPAHTPTHTRVAAFSSCVRLRKPVLTPLFAAHRASHPVRRSHTRSALRRPWRACKSSMGSSRWTA